MYRLKDLNWWSAAGTRAIKTFSQTMIGTIGATAMFSDVKWGTVLSASVLAALLSMLTSLAGLPEVQEDES